MSFFKVENLAISFGGLRALNDISFDIAQGEIYAIIGPNGAGKTTLFNCINGIYRPDRGKVWFKGEPVLGKKPDRVARMGIARTFQ
ncbi:MAG: ATP-binding cassette domain-containing protein, partial [Deltaproteobacteria bacterium]|nr:ATP-binding cassette domain-containing protein [Deltaproteobacteria bacterium]